MIKYWYTVIFLMLAFLLQGQPNCVLNPSFETALYPKIHEFSRKNNGQQLVHGWNVPTSGTSDYFDYDGSRIYLNRLVLARTDSGRAAIIAGIGRKTIGEFFRYPKGYAEYLSGSFALPLKAGETYCVSFYVAQHPDSKYSVDQIGAYLSTNKVQHGKDYAPLLLKPQVKTEHFITPEYEWTEVSGSYTAQGGERYITIGNFGVPDLQKTRKLSGEKYHEYSIFNSVAYYFVDDVSVKLSTAEESCTQEKIAPIQLKANSHYLFLLDRSGSMQGQSYMDSVQKNLPNAIQNLHPESKISLLSFSNDVKTEFLLEDPKEVLTDSSFWNNMNPGGVTSYRDAIYKAYEKLDTLKHYETTIVLISDGEFKVNDGLVEKVQEAFRNNGTHFSIMMMGEQIIPGDMVRLSTLSEGRAVRFYENDFTDLLLDRGYKVLPENVVQMHEKHSKIMAFVAKNFKTIAIGAIGLGLYLSLR